MNTATSTPATSASDELIANGDEPAELDGCERAVRARRRRRPCTSATTAKVTSVMTSAPSSPTCVRRRQLDADHADRGHDHDPDDADERDRERSIGGRLPVEEQERVEAGDLREVRHHDDVGDDDRPAADPAGPGAHRLGYPRERRAAVRVGAVHVVVRGRDEEHRDERDDHDRGRLHADPATATTSAEDGGERVARRGRGDADHDARDEPERVGLQPLLSTTHPSGHGGEPIGSVDVCPCWTTRLCVL